LVSFAHSGWSCFAFLGVLFELYFSLLLCVCTLLFRRWICPQVIETKVANVYVERVVLLRVFNILSLSLHPSYRSSVLGSVFNKKFVCFSMYCCCCVDVARQVCAPHIFTAVCMMLRTCVCYFFTLVMMVY